LATGAFIVLVESQVRIEVGRFKVALHRAEEANVAKDNFLAAVSHDLRNPLNAILLWCNALFPTQGLDAKVHRGIDAIHRAAKSQAQLIEDLLDVSRIESGKMRLDVQSCDLSEVVRSAVETLRPAAEAKSIDLQLVIDPKADNIMGDAQRLQQVVWNLVSNAVKFTHKAGKVQVRLERINSHAEITVADTGRGMDAQTLDHLFEPFWQRLDHSKDGGSSQGLGLGLAIVKNIVNLHGGTTTAHSEGIDKGSTFTVRLPLPPTTAGLLSSSRRHPTVSPFGIKAHVARLDGVSIMIVDDDRDALEALKTLLTSLGARVLEADSVDRAIAAIPEFQPDVLVTDLGMPVRDGYSLAREIRSGAQNNGANRIALVALTAYGRVEDKVQVFAAGFDNHLVKPVDPAELAAVVRHLLETRSTETVA
jgi:CheY-like chemotaxis protein